MTYGVARTAGRNYGKYRMVLLWMYAAVASVSLRGRGSMKYCEICDEPVLFIPILGWQHMTYEGLDHEVRLRR